MAAYTRNERWRPRRGKQGNYHSRQTETDTSFIFKDLEEQLTTLSVDATDSSASDVVRLRHVAPVASYSWIDAPVPTIAVPGYPRIWSNTPVTRVPLDAGVHFIHHDASKMGNHSPMLPFFAAIDAMHNEFPYAELDLITDRNGLRKLLRYADHVRTEDSFRIDVDVVGKTCLFTRREENSSVVGQPSGYGNEYLRAATGLTRGLEKMLDHHRIITYKFGSMKVLLGFTVDACVEQKRDEDDLLASLSSLSIGGKADKADKADKTKTSSETGLVVKRIPLRPLVPQSDLVEVKTRSVHREANWRETYPQVYLSQTGWLYTAIHSGGVFDKVEKMALTGTEMEPYAAMMERSMGKLKRLLKEILKAVREQGEGVPLSLVQQDGKLSLWRRKAGSGRPLPEEITARFRPTGA